MPKDILAIAFALFPTLKVHSLDQPESRPALKKEFGGSTVCSCGQPKPADRRDCGRCHGEMMGW